MSLDEERERKNISPAPSRIQRRRWRHDLFPTFNAINRFIRESLTPGGKAILVVILISMFGLVYLETPLIFLLASLLSIMITAGVISFIFRPQLKYSVLTPETAMFDQQTELEVYLRNPKRRSTYDLTVEARRLPKHFSVLDEESPFVPEVKRNATIRAAVPFRVRQRGITRFPRLRVSSSFPFNLFRFRQNVPVPGELIVLPRYFPLSAFSFAEATYEHAGQFENAANRAADTDQFLGSRELVPGMPVRRWDYASWARIGKPIVREYQSEQTRLASIFVDTFGPAIRNNQIDETFESLLSLAASLTDSLTQMQFTIEHLMLGTRDVDRTNHEEFDGLRRDDVFRELALAVREPEENLTEALSEDVTLLPEVSFLFVLMSRWDDRRSEMLRRINSQRNYVKPILIVRNSDDLPVHLPEEIEVVSITEIKAGAVEI